VTLVRNTMWLMAAQGVGMLGPFIMVPFLARALGPDGWAPVLAAQALAAWLILILDYASDLSGTRDLARARHGAGARDQLAEVFRGVQSAKALLVPLVVAIALLAGAFVPVLAGQGPLVVSALAFALFRGLNPFWYFQGVERVRFAASAEAVARVGSAVVVILVVRSPGDGWMVLAVQAGFAILELAVLTALVARETTLLAPTIAAGTEALRRTWPIFGMRAVGGVYTQASTLLLGVSAAPAVVAVYGGADRIIRAAISLLQPVTQAVLPRVSFLQAGDLGTAQTFVDRALWVIGLLGAAVGGAIYIAAPQIIGLLLGAGYEAAVPVLRVLAALAPIIAVSTVLSTYWALPFGRERLAFAAVVAAAVANLLLVWLLVTRVGAAGMCAAVIVAELVALAPMAHSFRRRER